MNPNDVENPEIEDAEFQSLVEEEEDFKSTMTSLDFALSLRGAEESLSLVTARDLSTLDNGATSLHSSVQKRLRLDEDSIQKLKMKFNRPYFQQQLINIPEERQHGSGSEDSDSPASLHRRIFHSDA